MANRRPRGPSGARDAAFLDEATTDHGTESYMMLSNAAATRIAEEAAAATQPLREPHATFTHRSLAYARTRVAEPAANVARSAASPFARMRRSFAAFLRTSRRQGRSGSSEEQRVVYINDASRNTHFPSNYVSTTKYSLWTALPAFLYEQLSKFRNAYFLLVGIGYTINAISPVFTLGRYSTLGTLGLVLLVTALREFLEDFRRYREDRRVNRAVTQIIGSRRDKDEWATVQVGDLLRIHRDEHIPADTVLVASSNEDGLAFVETKQLDGESNLKVKVVPPSIPKLFDADINALSVRGRIECEAPNDRLHKFHGSIIASELPYDVDSGPQGQDKDMSDINPPLSEAVSLGPDNIMIRGSSLQNTEWIVGVAVYTGRDTKLLQNVKAKPTKVSRLERDADRYLLVLLTLQICIAVILTIRSSQVCDRLFGNANFAWYLLNEDSCEPLDLFYRFFTFFITFSSLIPISLYVSMEIVRGFQLYFIEQDRNIRDPDTGFSAEVRTSTLNEELGAIHHIFSDKTGTLTANRMVFKKCSLGEKVFELTGAVDSENYSMRELRTVLRDGRTTTESQKLTSRDLQSAATSFRLLSLCHSVVAESVSQDISSGGDTPVRQQDSAGSDRSGDIAAMDLRHSNARGDDVSVNSSRQSWPDSESPSSSHISYQASSPDEAALVGTAKRMGFTFLSRSSREITIDVFGRVETHDLLEVIGFDSSRKRMSVITRAPDGHVGIYTKGADSVIFPRVRRDSNYTVTEKHVGDFAGQGLRTLCLAYADVDDEWFQGWQERYRKASTQAKDRETNVANVIDEIENNLTLLGATAIEDKLQDGVPETLKRLEHAGIKIWVLTGDKQETAINIGRSSGALNDQMHIMIINEDTIEDTAAHFDKTLGRWSAMQTEFEMKGQLGIVIDGQTLQHALDPALQNKFMAVSKMARAVIACRVSPKQKTEIIEVVRRYDGSRVTLAIGDGANDVGMIQAAHVGVGIAGVEGQEAKLASDFSIGQFRFLSRLLLVHGRWSYKRLSKMVLFTFYKNVLLAFCEVYWAPFSGFSGQPLLDPWMVGLYNVVLTSLPPIVLGIFDQEVVAEYALAFPRIYVKGQRSSAFNLRTFFGWIGSSVWQAAIIFFFCFLGFGDKATRHGQVLGMWPFGTVVFTVAVVNVHATLLVYQTSWTKLSAAVYVLSLLSWIPTGLLLGWKPIALDGKISPPLYGVVHRIFADARLWLLALLCLIVNVSPSLLWKYHKRRSRPNLKMAVQEHIRYSNNQVDS